jgi:heme-degrading monooxygenase HmoA
MIVEHATFGVRSEDPADLRAAATEITAILAAADGVNSVQVLRCVEEPSQCRLVIEWRELDDHLVAFRNSRLSRELGVVLASIRDAEPVASHFEVITRWPEGAR